MLLKVSELFIINAFDSHLNDFFDEGVLADDEVAIISSKELADVLDLV